MNKNQLNLQTINNMKYSKIRGQQIVNSTQ